MEISYQSCSSIMLGCPTPTNNRPRNLLDGIGITEKATRNIIVDLEADGYVTKKKEGHRVRYKVDPDLPLRHEIQQDKAIGDLLEVLGWKRSRRTAKKEVVASLSG